MHFAIVTATAPITYVVHALASIGRVVEHNMDRQWRSRILRAYSYRGID